MFVCVRWFIWQLLAVQKISLEDMVLDVAIKDDDG